MEGGGRKKCCYPKPIRWAKLFGDMKKASSAMVVITEMVKTLLMKAESVWRCRTSVDVKRE